MGSGTLRSGQLCPGWHMWKMELSGLAREAVVCLCVVLFCAAFFSHSRQRRRKFFQKSGVETRVASTSAHTHASHPRAGAVIHHAYSSA